MSAVRSGDRPPPDGALERAVDRENRLTVAFDLFVSPWRRFSPEASRKPGAPDSTDEREGVRDACSRADPDAAAQETSNPTTVMTDVTLPSRLD